MPVSFQTIATNRLSWSPRFSGVTESKVCLTPVEEAASARTDRQTSHARHQISCQQDQHQSTEIAPVHPG